MAEYPSLPLFTDAYLSDTRHLTTVQHGAYFLLLLTAWRSPDCSLPDDDIYLARVTGLDRRTWARNRDAVLAFWSRNGHGRWVQGRLLDERNYVEQLRNKNAAAGRASALKRLNRGSTTVPPDFNQTSTPTPTPTLKESPNGDKKARKVVGLGSKPSDYSPSFEQFWVTYPKSLGSKKEAANSYTRAIRKGTAHEDIIAGAKRYAEYIGSRGDGPRFTAHPSTWLNQERWVVEYAGEPESGYEQVLRELREGA